MDDPSTMQVDDGLDNKPNHKGTLDLGEVLALFDILKQVLTVYQFSHNVDAITCSDGLSVFNYLGMVGYLHNLTLVSTSQCKNTLLKAPLACQAFRSRSLSTHNSTL
jgi:hypothetical protein